MYSGGGGGEKKGGGCVYAYYVRLYTLFAVHIPTQPPKPQAKPKKSGGGGGGLFDEGEEEDDIFSFSTSAIKRARSVTNTVHFVLCALAFVC